MNQSRYWGNIARSDARSYIPSDMTMPLTAWRSVEGGVREGDTSDESKNMEVRK